MIYVAESVKTNGKIENSIMFQRRRKCCIFLLLVTFFSACSLMFSSGYKDMRAALYDYRTGTDADTRRLLQDDKSKAAPAPPANKPPSAPKNDDKKYRVPIFWDDGEFMDDVDDEEENMETPEGEVNKLQYEIPQSDEHIEEKVVDKRSVEKDPRLAVLDYKMDQTVKYSDGNVGTLNSTSPDGNAPEATSRVLPVHLLIVTQRRSGSSFLGQIFNQNPWVFFHFEPLKLLEIKKQAYPNSSVLLGNLLKCRFDKTPFLMDLYNNETLHRMSSKVLCTRPLCANDVEYNQMNVATVKQCPPLKVDILTNTCNTYPHKVVKMIRMYSIESLQDLLVDKELNLRIVHLLRDPRGTLLSRAKENRNGARTLSLGTGLDHDAAYICRRMRRNFNFVQENQELLKDRYLRVRYEDIAAEPERWTRTLYKFAGMGDVPVDVLDWIKTNTRASSQTDVQDVYSTHRNSSTTATAWRDQVDFMVVQEIQKLCKDVLKEARYAEIKHDTDLTNHDLNVLEPVT